MPEEEHPGLLRVREIAERLEDEVREMKASLQGGSLTGDGILARLGQVEEKQDELRQIVDGYERAERRREEDVKSREARRLRFQTAALGLLTVIIGGVLTQVILLYVTGVFGG